MSGTLAMASSCSSKSCACANPPAQRKNFALSCAEDSGRVGVPRKSSLSRSSVRPSRSAIRTLLAQARGEQGGIGFRAIGLEESEASFEDGVGTFEARLREARREDPGLGGASKVQALDHRAVAGLGEGQHAAAQRARDAERFAEPLAIKVQ